MMKFDEAALVRQLADLTVPRRVAFAAACAERLFPMYVHFHKENDTGDPASVERALSRLWSDLEGEEMGEKELRGFVNDLEALVPEEDESWTESAAYAQNAVAAVAYAFRCRIEGDEQEAAWAARQAYEAIDFHIVNKEDVDIDAPEAEETLRTHPLIQAELERQARDLGALQAQQSDLAELRKRAQAEAGRFLG